MTELSFHNVRDILDVFADDLNNCLNASQSVAKESEDTHLQILKSKSKQMNIVHLNTQSMTLSIDEFRLLLETYKFDIAALSETWLQDNPLLLNHVSIPEYTFEYHNGDKIRGGGVGFYIRESISYKRRYDIEEKYPDVEQMWLKLPGRNTHSRLLLAVVYRPQKLLSFPNTPNRITHTDVIPCPTISDHDAPYVCVNIHTIRYKPCYKIIRDTCQLNLDNFYKDCLSVPFSLLYSFNNLNDQLSIFNDLLSECLNRHATLKRIKVTHPPCPWLQSDELRKLQSERNKLKVLAHKSPTDTIWESLLGSRMSGFRKGHSTTTVLMGIRDDLLKAQKSGEVTLMLLADFSKSFDMPNLKTAFLHWMVSYLTDCYQY
ncbi:Hypothetical predicted protein [Paramuricea clavata]|uniref:Endonuclease/exonuclease/phosphatase domain-containing protein n=1 Tax=Paramuricea clavata TaxID=317549 RepID=A0A6S7H0L5_PARCT|nr:Hypothetical predicted protein [Paramuricea clavata]